MKKIRRVVAVDIGNTTTGFALFAAGRLIRKKAISTGELAGADKTPPSWALGADTVMISSVVPRALARMVAFLSNTSRAAVLVAGVDTPVPIRSAYDRRQIGQDRLVCAYAAARFYGAPVIVVDFGTALTFDVVSARGMYRGGLIFPGADTAFSALTKRAALLPQLRVTPPSGLIGTDTQASMRSGLFYGYSSLCDAIIARLRNVVSRRTPVVLTGGYARLLSGYLRTRCTVDEDLIFKGLYLLSTFSRGRRVSEEGPSGKEQC